MMMSELLDKKNARLESLVKEVNVSLDKKLDTDHLEYSLRGRATYTDMTKLMDGKADREDLLKLEQLLEKKAAVSEVEALLRSIPRAKSSSSDADADILSKLSSRLTRLESALQDKAGIPDVNASFDRVSGDFEKLQREIKLLKQEERVVDVLREEMNAKYERSKRLLEEKTTELHKDISSILRRVEDAMTQIRTQKESDRVDIGATLDACVRETELVHNAMNKMNEKYSLIERKTDTISARVEALNYKQMLDKVESVAAAVSMLHTSVDTKADATDLSAIRRTLNQVETDLTILTRAVDDKVDIATNKTKIHMNQIQNEVERLKVTKCDEERVDEVVSNLKKTVNQSQPAPRVPENVQPEFKVTMAPVPVQIVQMPPQPTSQTTANRNDYTSPMSIQVTNPDVMPRQPKYDEQHPPPPPAEPAPQDAHQTARTTTRPLASLSQKTNTRPTTTVTSKPTTRLTQSTTKSPGVPRKPAVVTQAKPTHQVSTLTSAHQADFVSALMSKKTNWMMTDDDV